MLANNHEFPTTTLVGVRTMGHQQFDLALHLAHWMLANGIRHLQLSVIFLVYIPLKNCIQEIVEAIGLCDQKLGVS
jgi:hypothetical protein